MTTKKYSKLASPYSHLLSMSAMSMFASLRRNWWLMTAFFWLAAAASIQGQMKRSVSSDTANRVGRAAIILYHMNSTVRAHHPVRRP